MDIAILFWVLCIYTHVIFSSLCLTSSVVIGNETDRLALLDFSAKISHDPFGVLNSWNTTVHFCQWHGVTCGVRHRRVTRLILPHNRLAGSISQHIGNLTFLRELNLANNNFTDQIPREVGGLWRLQRLILANNTITGKFPSNISAWSNLIEIDFDYNQIVGNIPVELGSLSRLTNLLIIYNKLTGSIPSSLGNISSLQCLFIHGNSISGRIPDSLGMISNLQTISIGENNLTGNIPPSLFNHSVLRILNANINQLEGILPWDLGITLPNIEHFSIGKNQFTGPIPVTLSNASNLMLFAISTNQFSGKVPPLERLQRLQRFAVDHNQLGSGEAGDLDFLCSMANAVNLGWFLLHFNNFGGMLPKCIGNLSTSLKVLIMGTNKIQGSIPFEMGNLVGLEKLVMNYNSFAGAVPSSIGNLRRLKIMHLDENRLSGSIPSTLGNLTMVTELYLNNNSLEGSIPASLGRCQNLLFLTLYDNNLDGSIPPQIMRISSLVGVDLSGNRLTGPLPTEIGMLKGLGFFDVSYNMLSGSIPSSLGSCISMESLYLQHNLFQGSLPSTLSSLRALDDMDLSSNKFSGNIPEFLEGLSLLKYLNLSYNIFQGKVPDGGVFKNATAAFLLGNKALCGGITEFKLHPCDFGKSKKGKVSFSAKLGIAIIAGVLSFTFLLSFLFIWLKKKENIPASDDSDNSIMRLSYQNLYNAMNGFSDENLIGCGSFGSVYKATLDQGTKNVAVKVLNLQNIGAPKSFVAECNALRNIRHRNLVKLLTACSTVDYQGNDFRGLVYEFMVNGSLDEWLHPGNELVLRKLKLLQRLNISINIASALEYLHHDCEPPIAHCDLKPSNILLDAELTGHVGDFGLSRFLPLEKQNDSITRSSTLGVQGTVGYAAPEYGLGSKISTSGDIYSYGIIVLEMFTGRRPTDETFKEELNIHKFVKEALPEKVTDILDPFLIRELVDEETGIYSYEQQEGILECLNSIFEIGVRCSQDSPTERMDMSDVVTQLHSIKQKLLQNGLHTE